MERKIVIGYDGSEHAEDALALGAVLAPLLDATPVVAAALPIPLYRIEPEELRRTADSHAAPLFERAAQRLAGLELETRALPDPSPARALHGLAEDEGPLLTVIGSTHRGPLNRILLGSVGQSLLSGAPGAIAVAPRGYADREEHRLLRIAAAVDGGEECWAALTAATSLATRARATLAVLAVAEPPRYGYGDAVAVLSTGEYESAEERRMQEALEHAIERVPHGMPVERRLMKGPAGPAIAAAAEDFDLLVLGSRGYGPLRRALLGSVSTHLLRESPCPVLILPRGAGEAALGFESALSADDTGDSST